MSHSAATNQVNVVVFRNLSFDTTVPDIEEALKGLGLVSSGIDRKVDSMGEFKGTAFIRCIAPEIALLMIRKVNDSGLIIKGKKVKAEMLRQSGLTKSLSAKDILEADRWDIDEKAARVRDLITAFVYSDKQEILLPLELDSDQRKLAHSLAEKFGLVHATVSGEGMPLNLPELAGNNHAVSRSVLLTKHREQPKSRMGSMRMGLPNMSTQILPEHPSSSKLHSAAGLMTAAATNDLAHMKLLLPMAHPEVPVYAVAPMNDQKLNPVLDNMDEVALMHARKAQIHAEAAREALLAAKVSKESSAMPAWLEIVHQDDSSPTSSKHYSKSDSHGIKFVRSMRKNSGSFRLNANAPEFIPSKSFLAGAPPGL